ncbi:glycosyltransferase [Paraburkholderia bengalensis]|uniref:Glycosyltransferase n=1 Tax=Paraburkholderia bengalensis TaxID=2747562 RepID=A0ABU8J525_9BURK
MRILYTNFHRHHGGGHDTYLLCLIAALAHEHAITVAVPGSSRLYGLASKIPGVQVASIDYSTRGGKWWHKFSQLRRLICRGNFDVVHVNGSADHRLVMLATSAARKRPRIVFTKHNDYSARSAGNLLRAWLATDHVIAVSDFVASNLVRSPYRRRQITTIRHGIDHDRFAPTSRDDVGAIRARYFGAAHRGKVVLGSTAGTSYEKGWLDLLTAISHLPSPERNSFLVIIAGSMPTEDLRLRVEKMGLTTQVVFTGLLDDVRPVLSASDVAFVLSHRETLSYACREAMAMGLPVLISQSGGLPENVKEGVDGWIVPVRDPHAIAAVLKRILRDPAGVGVMGCAARVKSQSEFGLTPFVAATLAVYGAAPPSSERRMPSVSMGNESLGQVVPSR